MLEQRRYYALYRSIKFGKGNMIKDLMQLPVHFQRSQRQHRFELFFLQYMKLSDEVSEPTEVNQLWDKYGIVISGSDQIWNKHSCELSRNEWRYMEPYLLIGYKGKKVSYASSIASMTEEELEKILPYVNEFTNVSMREQTSSECMTKMLGREIATVLDPTFLLDAEQWRKNIKLRTILEEPYILYYSLGGIKKVHSHINRLRDLVRRKNCRLIVVTPFAWYPVIDDVVENHPEYGPVEFLSAISGAKAVVTDSYHGTILSINFEKDLYTICTQGGSEFRKTDILKRLGMEDRIVYDLANISEKEYAPINYGAINSKLNMFREQSLSYLKNALSPS